MLTVERLKEVLHYEPSTGDFTWLKSLRVGSVGKMAGTLTQDRRVHIAVFGKVYKASRLAVLYMTGEWPLGEVDHINRIPNDDRWVNLRVVTRGQNMQNTGISTRNRTGVRNVYRVQDGYMVQVSCEQGWYRDTFPTIEQATDMANRMRTLLHGEYNAYN